MGFFKATVKVKHAYNFSIFDTNNKQNNSHLKKKMK